MSEKLIHRISRVLSESWEDSLVPLNQSCDIQLGGKSYSADLVWYISWDSSFGLSASLCLDLLPFLEGEDDRMRYLELVSVCEEDQDQIRSNGVEDASEFLDLDSPLERWSSKTLSYGELDALFQSQREEPLKNFLKKEYLDRSTMTSSFDEST